MRDATVPGDLAGIVLFASCLFLLPAASAQNPVLRDVEVRSFLGEPLNLRIALAASTEPDRGGICQSVIDGDRRENALRSSDLVLTMVELVNTRYLQVRSRSAFNEPVARFSLRIGCPGEPIVDQEFTVLLDPPPFTSLPVAAGGSAPSNTPTTSIPVKSAHAKPVVPASGTWSVYAGDTVTTLAKGIHPKNRARQRQYIAALRDLNPQIAAIADDAPLTPGTSLALPDLLTLSGILPGAAAVSVASAPAAAKKSPVAEKSATRPTAPAMPQSAVSTAPPAKPAEQKTAPPPAPKAPPAPAKAEPAKAEPPKAEPAKPAASAKAAPRRDGFQLRLSGSEMDLSRSRNVTDEQRRLLREKQLMLDADDQVAALLSLRNTVKQLEQRLNEMQLKLAATTSIRPTAPTPPAPAPVSAPASAPTSPPAAPASAAAAQKLPAAPAPAAAPQASPTPPSSTPPTPPAPETEAAPTKSAPAKPAPIEVPLKKSVAAEHSFADTIASYLPSPLLAGGIVAVLLILLGAWWWSRRDTGETPYVNAVMPEAPEVPEADETAAATTRPRSARSSAPDSDFPDTDHPESADALTAGQTAAEAFMRTSRNAVSNEAAAEFRAATLARANAARELVADEIAAAAHHQVDAPVIFDDSPASFVVDSGPLTTVDFLVGMDEKLPEDRVRRLQYMHERYPELKSNTISIDDADSVINAARLYYEESDKGNGPDKACELLTFAVEERPQEIRFWLAQFEIFRLENMVAEFTAMASKFHVLFSHTPAWPKVRHIGHELDPGNPLFAAGGSPLLAGETRFDPIAENWLHAPMDFASDALMSDLRLALLDDHGVSRADFESITARLSARAGTAQP